MFMKIQEIEKRNNILSDYLDRMDIIGYVCARNSMILSNELEKFANFRNDLVSQYGHEEVDENGNKTGKYLIDSSDEKYEFANSEFNKILNLERNLDIIKVKYSDVIGLLTGNEIIKLSWMLED